MAYTTTLFPSHCSAEEFLWPAIVLDKEPGIPGAHRSPGLALAMASSKLLLVLMAAASSLAAPQINEQKVVADVVASIGPKISEIKLLRHLQLSCGAGILSSEPVSELVLNQSEF